MNNKATVKFLVSVVLIFSLFVVLGNLSVSSVSALSSGSFLYTEIGGGNAQITGYTGPGGAVEIPGSINNLTVISIGDNAFNGLTNTTSFVIGSGITSIGNGSFSGCSGLTSIYIPSTVTYIGTNAFYGCGPFDPDRSRQRHLYIGPDFGSCAHIASVKLGSGVPPRSGTMRSTGSPR